MFQLVEISMSKPAPSIIITGHSLGGCVAMLFAFWLLNSLDSSKTKRPLCITFGSPLLGDEQLRQCVSKISTWNYCFLHVASTQDPTPKFFQRQCMSGEYKPFGTFLLCSASGCACSEDPDFILEQLAAPNSKVFKIKVLIMDKFWNISSVGHFVTMVSSSKVK